MRIQPRRRYDSPRYPTRDIVDADPETLRRVPARWRGKAAVLAALTATTGIIALRWSPARAEGQVEAVSQVAPIFPHGDGRGSFGCDAVAPPVFLSEDEARQVITEELKAAGLDPKPDAQTLPDVPIPVTSMVGAIKDTRPGALALDVADMRKRVGVEYISETDYAAWMGKDVGGGLRDTYDMKATAQLLRDGLAAQAPAGTYGVLYEPMVTYTDLHNRARAEGREWQGFSIEEARALAREQLKAQVKDFVTWLKAQGVI